MNKFVITAFTVFVSTVSYSAPAPVYPITAAERAAMMLRVADCQGASDALYGENASMQRARALFGEGEYVPARSEFLRIAGSNCAGPMYADALVGAADCLLAAGDFDAAYAEYGAIDTRSLSPRMSGVLCLRRGLCAYETAHPDVAKECFTEAIRFEETRSDAHFYLGILAFDADDYDEALAQFALVNRAVPPGSSVPYYITEIDFARGSWAKALSGARAIMQNGPDGDNPELLRIAGESLYRLGNESEALGYLKRYIAAEPEPEPSALYIVGVAAYAEGDYARALELLNPVAENASDAMQQSAYLFIGQALMQQGDNSAAMLAFDKASAMEADPDVREAAYYNYAVAKVGGGAVPFKSSSTTLEEFLRRYPSGAYSSRVAALLAEGYMADKDYKTALARLETVRHPSNRILATKQRVLYCLAWEALQAGRNAEAENYLNKAAAISAGGREVSTEIGLLQGRMLAAKGMHGEAIDYFRNYLDRSAASSSNRDVARYSLAYALYSTGQSAGAEKEFRTLAATVTDNAMLADVNNRLGDLRYASDDFKGAADYYRKAFDASPATGDKALFNQARMLGYMRDYSGKLDALDRFGKLFPNSMLMPDAMLETSQAQISLGRNTDAIATYRAIIDGYPTMAAGRRAYLQLALTLLDMNRRDEATETYRNVVQMYPSSPEAAQAASLLKSIYMEDGRGDEYLAFMRTVNNAPKIDAEEAEDISYETAMRAYANTGNTQALENFIDAYPQSLKVPSMLAAMLEKARKDDDSERAVALAARILERYPDSDASEVAMEVKAKALYDADKLPEALDMWQALEKRTSDADRANVARMGALRAAHDMGRDELAVSKADAIAEDGASTEMMREAMYIKAMSLEALGRTDEAMSVLERLGADASDLFGAKSAFRVAELLFESGDAKRALEKTNSFVQSGSPHHYWVARGFILLSDIYKAEGKDFEAREYLEALRENYPGTETDILVMIETRLNPSENE